MRRKLLAEISVSAAFLAVSSGVKSLELRLAQVSQRMKSFLSLCCLQNNSPVLAQEVQIRLRPDRTC